MQQMLADYIDPVIKKLGEVWITCTPGQCFAKCHIDD